MTAPELRQEIKRLRQLNANKDAVINQLQARISRYKLAEDRRKV